MKARVSTAEMFAAFGRAPGTLQLRRTPLQARGQETFERILEVTGLLLDKVGTEAVTTNLIAHAADINVATLYQYFPNKRSILVQLFQRHIGQRKSAAESAFVAQMAESGDWRTAIEAAIDAVGEKRRRVPGVVPLRQAMRADPELLAVDREGTQRVAQWLSAQIKQQTRVAGADADLVARCCIEVVSSLLDVWLLDSRGRDERVKVQLKAMVVRYLEPYFAAPSKARAASPADERVRRELTAAL